MPLISVVTQIHARGWMLVPVSVCGIWHGHFMVNTFTPRSALSASTATVLEACQCLAPRADRDHFLQGLSIGGQRLPDLRVRVSRAASLLEVEGMLGLDFLSRLASLHFDVTERRLTLEIP